MIKNEYKEIFTPYVARRLLRMGNTTKNKYYDEYKQSILCVDNNF